MTRPNPVAAGLACRCPNCGEGPLFCGFLRVCPVCDACGLDLAKADTGDGPAVFIILIVGALTGFGLLLTEIVFHPPAWVHLVTWVPTAGVLSIALLRPFKGVLVALQFHHKAGQASHDPTS